MKVKYLQPLADIRKRYENFFLQKKYFNDLYKDKLSVKEINKYLSSNYELVTEDEDIIKEEYLALCYLINLRYGFVSNRSYYTEEVMLNKPTNECIERTFKRHLFFLDEYLGCNEDNYKKYDLKIVQKEFLACKHYLFQFSLPAWVEKLPNELKPLDFEDEEELPIPNK